MDIDDLILIILSSVTIEMLFTVGLLLKLTLPYILPFKKIFFNFFFGLPILNFLFLVGIIFPFNNILPFNIGSSLSTLILSKLFILL